ncbi:helix-turn-helix domain-containing protein [Limosilactobacillus reuteri]|uniref:helix-turn-helix domain-containing protein n=1 Tax=Limosilactobacillus reuteri TaxID=1598 RepID=UPI00098F61E5|nr:helix-turn-helix domain-containing protein [Limosilactobacillus reuteri]WOZ74814.1 helix-turn-helix domain-containing protein [Limosilactobacillus reuteri]
MSKLVKLGKNTAFDKLTWQRKLAVIRLFEGKTLKEVSQEVHCHINTVENWKSMPQFQQARTEYSIYALNNLLPDAINELSNLITDGKSEMVRLQAIQTVMKHANLLSDNSTPELDKAKIRKANAEADIAEQKAQQLSKDVADDLTINIIRNDRSIENEKANHD